MKRKRALDGRDYLFTLVCAPCGPVLSEKVIPRISYFESSSGQAVAPFEDALESSRIRPPRAHVIALAEVDTLHGVGVGHLWPCWHGGPKLCSPKSTSMEQDGRRVGSLERSDFTTADEDYGRCFSAHTLIHICVSLPVTHTPRAHQRSYR